MKKLFKVIPLFLIIIFLGLYFIYQNGYYDKVMQNKITLTNENIEQFEQDILDGKDVSLDDYLPDEPSYATKTGNLSLKLSSNIENIFNNSIKYIFKKIASVVE